VVRLLSSSVERRRVRRFDPAPSALQPRLLCRCSGGGAGETARALLQVRIGQGLRQEAAACVADRRRSPSGGASGPVRLRKPGRRARGPALRSIPDQGPTASRRLPAAGGASRLAAGALREYHCTQPAFARFAILCLATRLYGIAQYLPRRGIMIFLSHTRADKPIVEPIALRLKEIYGEDKVFYDSWSIQPGDGIIDKMNEGLESPKFVFFFVSENSLKSNMVKIEWQNALFKATSGHCKIIPIRVDGCEMPNVLMQNLYLDLYANGIESTTMQIVNVIQGNSSFTPQHIGFSNLTYIVMGNPKKNLLITISASHLMEPNPSFLILVLNEENEIQLELNGGEPFRHGFNKDITLDNGGVFNAIGIAPLGGAITPKIPMRIKITPTGQNEIKFKGVMHRKSDDHYGMIPQISS